MHRRTAWFSLAIICIGLSIYAYQNVNHGDSSTIEEAALGSLVGPALGVGMAVISSLASIYTEVLMKRDVAFWTAQFWLYAWGTVFAGVTALVWDGKIDTRKHATVRVAISTVEATQHSIRETATYHGVLVLATAGVGLITANVLRQQSNLVKLVGMSLCATTVLLTEVVVFPELLLESITFSRAVGLGLITTGAWYYHHSLKAEIVDDETVVWSSEGHQLLKNVEPEAYAMKSLSDDYADAFNDDLPHSRGEFELAVNTASWTIPTPLRLSAAFLTWVLIGSASWLGRMYAPNYSSYNDTERFFRPLRLHASIWGVNSSVTDVRCVQDWVREENVFAKSQQLVNFESEFIDSSCPLYPIPDGGLIFHAYYAGPNRPFHAVAIDAFLATQRLEDGHKMIYWLESTDSWEGVIQSYASYSQFVEFRVFDPVKEAAGTCMATKPEFISEAFREEHDMSVVSWSDLVRVLLLYKYGGVWIDVDTILIRNLSPLLRAGPVVPKLGDVNHNNNFLIAGPVGSPHLTTLLSTACAMPYDEEKLHQMYPKIGGFIPSWLYNDALFQVCEQYTGCGFSGIPVEWVDAWGLSADHQDWVRPCDEIVGDEEIIERPTPPGLHGVFAWHARLNQYDDECVTDDSKSNAAQMVLRRIRGRLSRGLVMEGNDLFPGPAYGR